MHSPAFDRLKMTWVAGLGEAEGVVHDEPRAAAAYGSCVRFERGHAAVLPEALRDDVAVRLEPRPRTKVDQRRDC